MELDREQQRRVWDRVRGEGTEQMPQLRRMGLGELIWLLAENAAAYRSLARQHTGQESRQLEGLYRECRRNLRCLQGLCALSGEGQKWSKAAPPRESGRSCLEKCWFREKHLWAELAARAADPEYGVVMSVLARQTGQRCVTVLELLGESET